jgi:alkylhydroperoxidase family enzyme
MARVKLILKPSDFPGTPDAATGSALRELFEHMFPGQADPELPGNHSAFGIVARSPPLALRVVKLSEYIASDMPWTAQHRDLRQLAIQTLNVHFKCDFSFQSHLRPSRLLGLSVEQQAAIPYWRTANVFSDEQRLVIEYTLAVVAGDVPDELFYRVVGQYGEQQALGFTVAIAWWSFWAMIINATGTDFDFGYGNSSATAAN